MEAKDIQEKEIKSELKEYIEKEINNMEEK